MAHFGEDSKDAAEAPAERPRVQHRNTGRYNMARLRAMMQLDDWFRESVTAVVGGDPDELNWDTDDVVGDGSDNAGAVDTFFAQYTEEQRAQLEPVKAEFLERVAGLPEDS